MLAAAAVALFMPFGLLGAAAAAGEADVAAHAARDPASAVQLLLAFVTLSAMTAMPLAHVLTRMTAERRIEIAAGTVRVTECRMGQTREWSEPLAAYSGVVRRVRTSLASVHHDLILAHDDSRRVVRLASAAHISAEEIAAASRLLGFSDLPQRSAVAERAQPTPRAHAA